MRAAQAPARGAGPFERNGPAPQPPVPKDAAESLEVRYLASPTSTPLMMLPSWAPGGRTPEYIHHNADCTRLVKHFFVADKPVAQLCHAALVYLSLIYRGLILVGLNSSRAGSAWLDSASRPTV